MAFSYKRLLQVGICSLLLAAVGCGDDSAPDPMVNEQSSPIAKCEAIASAFCNRAGECGRQITGYFSSAAAEQAYVDACESSAQSDCLEVFAVTPSFDACLSALPRAACIIDVSASSGFSPDVDSPAICDDVLLAQ